MDVMACMHVCAVHVPHSGQTTGVLWPESVLSMSMASMGDVAEVFLTPTAVCSVCIHLSVPLKSDEYLTAQSMLLHQAIVQVSPSPQRKS
jgi:hypothetical protein